MPRLHRLLVVVGWPARTILIALIRVYRVTLSPLLGGGCRFHPTCSAYAEQAIREVGAVRGSVLTVWRILRCSPLTAGGVDFPPRPTGRLLLYEALRRNRATRRTYDSIARDRIAS